MERSVVTYTDGTEVREGDRIRYHQAPGGLLPRETDASGAVKWTEGVAARLPQYIDDEKERESARKAGIDPDELMLLAADGRYYLIFDQVVERL